MDWKEVECPVCHEKMQAPGKRENIICMFCGTTIFLNRDKDKNPFQPELFPQQVRQMLSGFEGWLEQFSYEAYPLAFDTFCKENEEFLQQVDRGILQQQASFLQTSFLKEAQAFIEAGSTKNNRKQLLYRLNIYIAVYPIPAILHTSKEEARSFCTSLGEGWGETFSVSAVKAADYESIFNGFKRKLCYITTAVCKALNKPEDCSEMIRLKEYRDGYFSRQPEGEALIEEYYNISPTILKRIEKTSQGKEKYLWIWNRFLLPCLSALEQGREAECGLIYQEMVNQLRKEYLEEWEG